jgi:capsule polysaccharide export protein KpsE/RkpR
VLDSREVIPPRGSLLSQSSGLMPRVSQIHLNYEAMKNQLRTMQDVLAVESEDHRETRESLNAFNAKMQVFMVVRNKNTFIAFITFSDIYVC